jgi:glutamate 5-kinase
LPAGIIGVEGPFERGDTVTVVTAEGGRVAYGITNYDYLDVERIRGKQSDAIPTLLGHTFGSEVVHRNNLVLL